MTPSDPHAPSPTIEGRTLLYVVTSGLSLDTFMQGHLAWFVRRGARLHVACADSEIARRAAETEGATFHPVPLSRSAVSPFDDLRTFFALRGLIRRLSPDVIHTGTPKAGFLGQLAARGRPGLRVHTVHGMRSELFTGSKRWVFDSVERTTARTTHSLIAVSHSLRELLITRKIADASRVRVLGPGSFNGVTPRIWDARNDFQPSVDRPFTLGFIGRAHPDKGIAETLETFLRLRKRHPDRPLRLLIVGAPEACSPTVERSLHAHPDVQVTGWVDDVLPWYREIDVVLMPSRREGFPTVPLEAAALGLPVVAFDATGSRDAILDGTTGYLVAPDDADQLLARVESLVIDDGLRAEMASAARDHTARHFAPEDAWRRWEEFYLERLEDSSTTAR